MLHYSSVSDNMLHNVLHNMADSGNLLHILLESDNMVHNIPVFFWVNVN
jgi:hypothetical protein